MTDQEHAAAWQRVEKLRGHLLQTVTHKTFDVGRVDPGVGVEVCPRSTGNWRTIPPRTMNRGFAYARSRLPIRPKALADAGVTVMHSAYVAAILRAIAS